MLSEVANNSLHLVIKLDFPEGETPTSWPAERQNMRACSVNFCLMRETADMRLRRIPAKELLKKRCRKQVGKQPWIEYLREMFLIFSPM